MLFTVYEVPEEKVRAKGGGTLFRVCVGSNTRSRNTHNLETNTDNGGHMLIFLVKLFGFEGSDVDVLMLTLGVLVW